MAENYNAIGSYDINDMNISTPEGVRTLYGERNSHVLISDFLKKNIREKCVILCIGTDRYIGDCLGPLVGTFLSKLNIIHPVIGTLENPVHAINLKKSIQDIKSNYPNHKIVAIDASLGAEDAIGVIHVKKGCLHPGKGVGKKLPAVGDISIVGIVDSFATEEDSERGNFSDYGQLFPMHNIRLNLVMKMAEVVTRGIYTAFEKKD